MAYSKGFSNNKILREKFQHVSFVREIEAIAQEHLAMTADAPVPCKQNANCFQTAPKRHNREPFLGAVCSRLDRAS